MAGKLPGFDADRFRDRLRFVWTMAGAPVPDDRVVFHFEPVVTAAGPLDADQVPFDPSVAVVEDTPAPVQVICAVEYVDREAQATPFGLMSPSKVRITLLDEQYEQVKDAKYVVIAGDRYDYRRTEPPTGLADVGIFVMHFTAESET